MKSGTEVIRVKRYTETHEWAELLQDGRVRVGISDHAQKELGDVVYVDLPPLEKEVKKGEAFMTIESVKAAEDVYAPVSGKVVAVNEKLSENPELVNEDAEGEGWLVEIEMSDPSELDSLMTPEQYEKFIEK